MLAVGAHSSRVIQHTGIDLSEFGGDPGVRDMGFTLNRCWYWLIDLAGVAGHRFAHVQEMVKAWLGYVGLDSNCIGCYYTGRFICFVVRRLVVLSEGQIGRLHCWDMQGFDQQLGISHPAVALYADGKGKEGVFCRRRIISGFPLLS
jgi:hypothetical protein